MKGLRLNVVLKTLTVTHSHIKCEEKIKEPETLRQQVLLIFISIYRFFAKILPRISPAVPTINNVIVFIFGLF